jgi:purine nucleosidase/pyrimidine-specific ribonucleoside hydrolase
MAVPMILDCDPGHDDAMAILLAAADPAADLLAVTTVAGNSTLEKVTLNARRICTVAGLRDIPIAAGADRPLQREPRIADDVHGESGMDGPAFGEPDVPVADEDAVGLMRRLVSKSPEPVTLVPTGPLTNIARLLIEHPEVRTGIREIVWMGGSTGRGNTTPYAEFNALVDPEAADQVVRSGVPFTMCGLNITHQAAVTQDVVNRLRDIGTELADVCVELMTYFAGRYRDLFGFEAPPLHDPVAVARVLDPTSVRCVEANLVVETKGEWTSGATCVDLYGNTGRPANARVGVELDVERFWDRFVEAVRTLG